MYLLTSKTSDFISDLIYILSSGLYSDAEAMSNKYSQKCCHEYIFLDVYICFKVQCTVNILYT